MRDPARSPHARPRFCGAIAKQRGRDDCISEQHDLRGGRPPWATRARCSHRLHRSRTGPPGSSGACTALDVELLPTKVWTMSAPPSHLMRQVRQAPEPPASQCLCASHSIPIDGATGVRHTLGFFAQPLNGVYSRDYTSTTHVGVPWAHKVEMTTDT